MLTYTDNLETIHDRILKFSNLIYTHKYYISINFKNLSDDIPPINIIDNIYYAKTKNKAEFSIRLMINNEINLYTGDYDILLHIPIGITQEEFEKYILTAKEEIKLLYY